MGSSASLHRTAHCSCDTRKGCDCIPLKCLIYTHLFLALYTYWYCTNGNGPLTGHGTYIQHHHLSTLPLCVVYIDIVLGAAEDWSFGTKVDLVRSDLSKLVQPGSDPPAIVLIIRLDLIARNTMLFSRLDDGSLISIEVEFGRGDGRVVGIVPPGRDSI